MPTLAADSTHTAQSTRHMLAERLRRIERSIAEQQEEYAATRARIHALIAAGDAEAFDALNDATDLALNLQGCYRRELDLLGELAATPAGATLVPPDAATRLRGATILIAHRKKERKVIERRIEELRARDDPAAFEAIDDGSDIDRNLRSLQQLEIELRLALRALDQRAAE